MTESYLLEVDKKTTLETAGAKAYNLGRLIRYKYNVPSTLVLSVEAFRTFFRYNRLDDLWVALKRTVAGNKPPSQVVEAAAALRRAVIMGEIPEDIHGQIAEAANRHHWLHSSKAAVRSSAINEDLVQHSFAGQYSSYLNVETDSSSLVHAIKGVWASQWSETLVIYCRKNDLDIPGPEIAVIIQQMVDAEIAGVLFSRNPYNLNANEIIVEYVSGLGDALVSGEKTPTHLVYQRRQANFKNADKTLTRSKETPLRLLIAQALHLEKKTGLNVDLEWALADKQIYILQMRPITTMGQGILWTDENVGEVIPDIVTPYSWSILNPITNNAFRNYLSHAGIENYPPGGLFGLFNGKVYFNRSAFQETLDYFYPSSYLRKLSEEGASRAKKIRRLLLFPLQIAKALLRFYGFSQKLPARINAFYKNHKDLLAKCGYKKDQTVGHALRSARSIVQSHEQTMFLHISDTIFAELFYQVLRKLGARWLPAEYSVDRLLSGLDGAESVKSGEALWEIAQKVRGEQKLEEVFAKSTVPEIEVLIKQPEFKEIRRDIGAFIRDYGHGALHEFELLFPRWWEDRAYIYTNINNYLENPSFDLPKHKAELRRRREELYEQALKKLSFLKRMFFKFLYRKAVFFSTHRENLKQRFLMAHSLLKKHLLHIGRHLKHKAVFAAGKDIFFVEHEEIPALLNDENFAMNIMPEIEKRRKRRSENKKSRHPRRLMQIGETWKPLYDESEETSADMNGIGCSSGLVEGPVRVIEDESMFVHLQKGEILVAKSTNPGWTPLFVSAAGVITEIGGALSHGAIIAREYGLPMVAAVNNATRQLKTGDIIRLNGDSGHITILKAQTESNGQNSADTQ